MEDNQKILAKAVLLLQNNPQLLSYLLSLPPKYTLEELKDKIGHKCKAIEFGDYLLEPDELAISEEDLREIMKESERDTDFFDLPPEDNHQDFFKN